MSSGPQDVKSIKLVKMIYNRKFNTPIISRLELIDPPVNTLWLDTFISEKYSGWKMESFAT